MTDWTEVERRVRAERAAEIRAACAEVRRVLLLRREREMDAIRAALRAEAERATSGKEKEQ
jgi:hypothetical protein